MDIVLEDRRRNVVGLEIKAGASVTSSDFKGLDDLAGTVGKRFRRGVVLHAGEEAVRAGPALHAVPIGTLWKSDPSRSSARR